MEKGIHLRSTNHNLKKDPSSNFWPKWAVIWASTAPHHTTIFKKVAPHREYQITMKENMFDHFPLSTTKSSRIPYAKVVCRMFQPEEVNTGRLYSHIEIYIGYKSLNSSSYSYFFNGLLSFNHISFNSFTYIFQKMKLFYPIKLMQSTFWFDFKSDFYNT